jgi:hypothetical protein
MFTTAGYDEDILLSYHYTVGVLPVICIYLCSHSVQSKVKPRTAYVMLPVDC